MPSDDLRRHRKQMSASEIEAVETVVHSQPRSAWVFGPHAYTKMLAKDVSHDEVLETLRDGRVIEANVNRDLCVVFRKEFKTTAVCVVVALKNRWIVTVWRNPNRDNHETLDIEKYNWNTNLSEVMEPFYA